MPHEIGVFLRSDAELDRAQTAVEKTGLPFEVLDENVKITGRHISINSMHLARGLEFLIVVVMVRYNEVVPQQERIEMTSNASDLEDVYNTEGHLIYVTCTRARDHLLGTSVETAFEFHDDPLL